MQQIFREVRTKRNGINYYGEHVTYNDWKSIEVQIKLYISTLKKEVEKKLQQKHKVFNVFVLMVMYERKDVLFSVLFVGSYCYL